MGYPSSLQFHQERNRFIYLERIYPTAERNELMATKRREWPLIMSKKRLSLAYLKTHLTPVMIGNCGVINLLNGTPENNSPNEKIIHKDQWIASYKRKADIFIKHYTGVSKIYMSKKDRTENKNLKISLWTD